MTDNLVNLFQPKKPAQAEEPGTEYITINEQGKQVATMLQLGIVTKLHELQAHNKAIRTTGAQFKAGLNGSIFEGLAIVDYYLKLHEFERDNIDQIVDWSGAANAWKRRVYRDFEKAINSGYLIQTGKNIEVSHTGAKVVQAYNDHFAAALENYRVKAERIKEKRRIRQEGIKERKEARKRNKSSRQLLETD